MPRGGRIAKTAAADYPQRFAALLERLHKLNDYALIDAAGPAAVARFLQGNHLGPGRQGYDFDQLKRLPNLFNYGDVFYDDHSYHAKKLNRFCPLCQIGPDLLVGNYVAYRAIAGANLILNFIPLYKGNNPVKSKLVQSFVCYRLPCSGPDLEIIYKPNHLGVLLGESGRQRYQVGALFDQTFEVWGPPRQGLTVQKLLSPDVQEVLLDHPRNIGISGSLMTATFGGAFYGGDEGPAIAGQVPGEIRDQILDSVLIFQQLLEQLDGSYKVVHDTGLAAVPEPGSLSLRHYGRKRLLASILSWFLPIVVIIALIALYLWRNP
ncbi:MAG: hypothetical protein LBL67_02160 [Coriobacteriales bacterium]|jgi:hypothetical protein|nr:hypothetical protein [Coriobacteriales bacterium]